MTPDPIPCAWRSLGPPPPKNGNIDCGWRCTTVVEMVTTEGNTRSATSAIETAPLALTCVNAGWPSTVTFEAGGSAVTSLREGAPPLAQPVAANANVRTGIKACFAMVLGFPQLL